MTRKYLIYDKGQLLFNNNSLNSGPERQTPYYLYSMAIFSKNIDSFISCAAENFNRSKVCYALKANSHPKFLKYLASINAGADVVSIGELDHAIEHGIKPENIVFSGVGKTAQEIQRAMSYNIFSFNVESFSELECINNESKKRNIKTDIAIRLNPKVNSLTHKYISTGNTIHKFGILISEFEKCYKERKANLWSHINLKGLSIHIGSQLLDLSATSEGIKALCKSIDDLKLEIDFIDVGGGLGINYHTNKDENQKIPDINEYMQIVRGSLGKYASSHQIVFEPGRKIAANAGVLITSVVRQKQTEGHNFLIIDAGMNDLMPPCLYQAKHQILAINQAKSTQTYDIVGPVCESSDSFLIGYEMDVTVEGDQLLIADVGAYGKSLSNTYNMREMIKEYFID